MFKFKKSKLEKLIEFIKKSDNKLSAEDKEKIIKLIKPTIGIQTKKLHSDDLKIGSSKIGGKPLFLLNNLLYGIKLCNTQNNSSSNKKLINIKAPKLEKL
ncbi:MAG: hypothetical protein ACOVKP_00175, partial [Flavobacterium sp.]